MHVRVVRYGPARPLPITTWCSRWITPPWPFAASKTNCSQPEPRGPQAQPKRNASDQRDSLNSATVVGGGQSAQWCAAGAPQFGGALVIQGSVARLWSEAVRYVSQGCACELHSPPTWS